MLPELAMTPGGQFGVYVHVPFCATRCGYCDFNTYTPGELAGVTTMRATEESGEESAGRLGVTTMRATAADWLDAVRAELALAARRLPDPTVDTVFVGGGTPSLLGASGPSGLAAVLDAVRDSFTLADGAEVTTEANPESTSPEFFGRIWAAGYTRVSLGMQSVAPAVLRILDRTHSPGRALDAAREALAAGFEHVNIDLIYGTPGETDDDLHRSLDAAVTSGIDHLSAYALVVEDGTALARRVRRGEIPAVDDDVLAARYELLDGWLTQAGFDWYEVSNWSRPGGECRHNVGYWNGGQWWGAGPGAHGFVGSTRWWNAKHPSTYANRLAGGELPVAGFETLDAVDRHTEEVLLGVRLRDGLALAVLDGDERARAADAVRQGLLRPVDDRLVLTHRGRLLADGVVRTLLTG